MATVAPDLRPRSAVELYDAALHLCLRGGTALPALALAGAVPPAVAGLWLVYRVIHGLPFTSAAALFSLCLMLRSIFAGAAALAGEASLEGSPLDSGAALRRALSRAPSLMSAGGMLFLLGWLFVPISFGLGLVLWSSLYGGHALVARGEAGPFTMGGACRRRLGREPTFLVRLLHSLALLVTLFNLHTGIAVALYLGRALLALDVTFLERFASLDNAFYVSFVIALAFVLLEPVKSALGLLLLVDARVRSEGLDLRAAVDRLAARNLKSAALLLAMLAGLTVMPRAAGAQGDGPAAERDAAQRLEQLAADLGISDEPAVRRGLEAAASLSGPEAAALRRFAESLESHGEDGDAEWLEERLRLGLDQVRAASEGARGPDPRPVAREILNHPEFRLPEEQAVDVEDPSESFLSRLLRWLFRKREPDEQSEAQGCGSASSRSAPIGGVGGSAFEVITPVLVALAIVAVVWLIAAALRREWKAKSAPAAGEGAVAAGAAARGDELLSALARPPEGWASEADRLARAGDFRSAVRALYLAVLSSLHRRGAIDYDPTRSNWDYVRAFRGEGGERPALRELTRCFDFAWYGRQGANSEGYARARGLAQPFLDRREAAADA